MQTRKNGVDKHKSSGGKNHINRQINKHRKTREASNTINSVKRQGLKNEEGEVSAYLAIITIKLNGLNYN